MTNQDNLAAVCADQNIDEDRMEALKLAAELGATTKALEALRDAVIVWQKDSILLPPHRFELLSRGRGWCRKGKGKSAQWADREQGGYRVTEPGRWSVGGHDGFSRKGALEWDVEHITVGEQTWTIAN